MKKILLLIFLLALNICWATNTDRFTKVTAKGLNESLYTAIVNGDLGGASFNQESPTGTGTAWSVSATPTSVASVRLTQDGLVLDNPADYTISGKNITLTASPTAGQTLKVFYAK